ncbi:helix-turn-helix transcriptional regulator [Paenibacillus sp. FSL R7-0128]|uniref:helix-turn-helix transcriptional regulator n=1 Tax=Paenibacillus sp. FSL R7-0128 TaxID=2954529 RepID=UPI0030F835A5
MEEVQYTQEITLRALMNGQPCLKPELFLHLARAIAAAVGKLHQQQLLHLALRPEHIVVYQGEQTAEITAPCSAVYRSAEGYILPPGYSLPAAGLPYCSPENTGRMHRAVDERSDLYSLGIIFYEMLAGRLPFQAEDSLEWVYMHLAQSPPPLAHTRADLPEGLESIIMKLLSKNPDKRYPSTHVLISDLDTLGLVQDRILTQTRYHGRTHELATLTQAFYSACLGSTEMVYISGEAGIGKTSLMEQMFQNQQHARQFFYITGKFEQISSQSPYHPIIQAFRGLLRHLLGERRDTSEFWAERLRNALGSSAHIITAMIPEAARILGDLPEAETLPANESKKRFIYVFRKFVQALASREHPLVLFIDDLQWANDSSLQLIHELLCDPECQYLMFVCAYRHETDLSKLPGYEEDGTVTDQALVHHIHLAPLSLAQMNPIVMEALNSPADTALALTELVYPSSGGNPFHFKQILRRLQDDSILRYSPEQRRWQWNLGQIIEQTPSYAVKDLLEHRLHRLPEDARQLLAIAACIGSVLQAQDIVHIAGQTHSERSDAWSILEAEGMMISCGDGQFRFAHDNIQKLIYSRIDDEARHNLHLRIGRFLLERDGAWIAHAFDAVNQLNLGSAGITDPREILQLVRLNLEAGIRAKTSSAYDIALEYFAQGLELLPAKDWENEFDLCFELYIHKAECEYLCGNIRQSELELDALLQHARNPVERSRIQLIRIMQYINQGRYLEGTALGLSSLREHRIMISPRPGKVMLLMESMKLELLLNGRYDRLAHLKEMSDPERIAAMNLLFAVVPSTFFTNKKVYFLLVCRAIQLSLTYGNTPASAAVYSAYGMILGNTPGKARKGYTIGEVGLELSDRYNIPSIKSKTYTVFGGVLCQFAGNSREGEAYLAKALRHGLDAGDYVFASYAIGAHINALYSRAPLGEFARTLAEYAVVLDTTKDEFVKKNIQLFQQWILALQGRSAEPDSFSGAGFREELFLEEIRKEETSSTTLFQYCTYKTQLCWLLGRYDQALQWARKARVHEAYATHLPHLPECLMYEALSLMSMPVHWRKSAPEHRRLRRILRRFRQWSLASPVNYQSRYDLLQAEFARVSGQLPRAEEMYDRAIREAREYEEVQITALTGELAARYYWSCGKSTTALFYLETAAGGYSDWEVLIKVSQIEELRLQWQAAVDPVPVPASTAISQGNPRQSAEPLHSVQKEAHAVEPMDLAAILQTSQAITNPLDIDTVLREMMSTLMKYAGASKGSLLTGNQDTLYIQTYADSENPSVSSPAELTDSILLPEGIIRYVYRTQEEVHYTGGSDSWLIHNPYMAYHRPGSALCIPVTVHGMMLGVLYLENKLTSGIFADEHKAVLLALASRALLMCVLQSSGETPGSQTEQTEALLPLPALLDEPLTERELEVLTLLAAGLSNKEIADQLIIAISTVKVHVKNIFAKLKVNRRTKAIAQAQELKLLG